MTLSTEVNSAIEKGLARSIFKKKRSALSSERRKEACADLNLHLLPLLKTYQAVLSFQSLAEEIDTTGINHLLAEEGKLHLPKVEQSTFLTRVLDNRPMKIDEISDGFCTKIREAGVEDAASERILIQNTPKDIDCHRVLIQNSSFLQIYQVNNPSSELLRSHWGLFEPDPFRCPLTDLKNIDCILIPGLGFDRDRHRIGYGKGHYDQLLAQFMKHSFFPMTIGIGFKEQFCQCGLPHETHDVQLDELKLF
jgi:5-formyltetrahydrofolate cyclo-ligase